MIFGIWSCKSTFFAFDNDCHLCMGPGAVWNDVSKPDKCFCMDPFSPNYVDGGVEAVDGQCTCGDNNEWDNRCIPCNGPGEFISG